jgi:hypothetical protein
MTYAKLLAVHTRCDIDGGLPVAVAGLDTPSVGGEKPRGIGRVTWRCVGGRGGGGEHSNRTACGGVGEIFFVSA